MNTPGHDVAHLDRRGARRITPETVRHAGLADVGGQATNGYPRTSTDPYKNSLAFLLRCAVPRGSSGMAGPLAGACMWQTVRRWVLGAGTPAMADPARARQAGLPGRR